MKGKSLRFPDKQSVFKIFSYKEKGYRERFDRELEAYRLLDSSGAKIAPEFRGCYCANGMYLILELEDCGVSLEGKDAKPYENQIRDLFKKLHLSGIIHNDVASRNLLVDGNGQVLLCDFGLAEMRAEGTTEEEWSQKALEDDEMVDMLFEAGEQEMLIDE
jgi:serine/threonine protein kinase